MIDIHTENSSHLCHLQMKAMGCDSEKKGKKKKLNRTSDDDTKDNAR